MSIVDEVPGAIFEIGSDPATRTSNPQTQDAALALLPCDPQPLTCPRLHPAVAKMLSLLGVDQILTRPRPGLSGQDINRRPVIAS